jgi:hypothetical protein
MTAIDIDPKVARVLAGAPKSKNAKVTLVYQHELPQEHQGRARRIRPRRLLAWPHACQIRLHLRDRAFRAEILRREKMRDANERVRVLVKPDVAADITTPKWSDNGWQGHAAGSFFTSFQPIAPIFTRSSDYGA